MLVVIDTNVAVVANGKSGQASPECVAECATRLGRITEDFDCLALDDRWLILKEYCRNLNDRGQPGVGDAFLKWALTNQANPSRCVITPITPINGGFKEFPATTDLSGFDPSDRKFVAVALAHLSHPPILQAVDSKWWNFKEVLANHGATVDFICKPTGQNPPPGRQKQSRKRTGKNLEYRKSRVVQKGSL